MKTKLSLNLFVSNHFVINVIPKLKFLKGWTYLIPTLIIISFHCYSLYHLVLLPFLVVVSMSFPAV